MTSLLEINQLSVAFHDTERKIVAIDHLDFCLNSGETLALLGESGCGKSLTSLAIMRLLPNGAMYGQSSAIRFGGQDVLDLPERLMRCLRGRRLAMIFQEPMTALNPVLSLREQLVEALTTHQKLDQVELEQRLLSLMNDVEMPDPLLRLSQYPHQLSGGQKQRVVIAMALASHPDVLIADEPTTALDVTIQAQILMLLKKLQTQYKMSLLLITHDLGVVKAMANMVCVMYAGQLVEVAPAPLFFSQPKHPYAQQLLASLPSFVRRTYRLPAIPGQVPVLEEKPLGCRFHPRCAHAFELCATSEPVLQQLEPLRTVRCHLYPTHSIPPALPCLTDTWPMRPKTDEVLLSVEKLAVYFEQKRLLWWRAPTQFKAVDGISLTLYKGQTLALVGESGCGKTTLSRALLRLQPIASGAAFYRGQSIATLRGRALRRFREKVQIIFQDPYSSMNPRMTVDDILAEGLRAQGMRAKAIRQRQLTLLDQVNLPKNCLSRYPHQFSGGQRQRICIARALAVQPELLICDEPTSALDVSVQAQILNLLKMLQQEFGLSYLFITHNMGVVSYMADQVLVMQGGIAVETGSCESILSNPQHPYTRQLLSSVLTIC